MRILIPYFDNTLDTDYPDSAVLFYSMKEQTFNSTKYWLCEYVGTENLETGPDTYADYAAWLALHPAINREGGGDIEVLITGVTGAVKHTSDFTWVTCVLGKDVDIEFDLAVGEARTFAMTLSGQKNTPDAKFFAVVGADGKGKVTLNFDAMGDYVYTNVEANKGLTTPLFFTKSILIEVGKATGSMLQVVGGGV